MKTPPHALAIAVVIAASGASHLARADPNALCAGLATHARSLPPIAWRQGVEQAMAPALAIEEGRNPELAKNAGLSFERSLTQLPWVREALDDEEGNWSEFVSRLPGHDIYMVSTYQGTLHCQSAAFVSAHVGAAPTAIPAPAVFGEGEGPCWTQSGMLGTVNGQPAFIEGGADSDHTFDASYKIVPWTGAGWGQGCTLSLQFRTEFELAARHCGDGRVCRAADGLALKLARAYDDFRQTDDAGKPTSFVFGPPEPVRIARQRLIDGRSFVKDTPEFPRFGDKDETPYGGSFSYSGFQYLPLRLGGRWYVVGIGHEGVGWRETGWTLIAIYDEKDGMLTPKASFEVRSVNAGLDDAHAEPGG